MSRTKGKKPDSERRKKEKKAALVANGSPSPAESPPEVAQDAKDKKRKRKREEAGDDVKSSKKSKKSKKTEDADTPMEDAPTPVEPTDAKSKKSKKSKKRKAAGAEDDEATETAKLEEPIKDTTLDADFIALDDETGAKPSKKTTKDKKKKKDKKSAKEAAPDAKAEEDYSTKEAKEATVEASEDAPAAEADGEAEANGTEGPKGRFIVFVGNLPFSVTKEQLENHFEKVAPTAVRLSTEKKTGKPRGFAFIEFDRFDRMETCLKKYQHSVFPDAKRKEGRKINIELTAGGGGNTEARKEKIQVKNVKLQDERQRDREKRDELEAKQQQRKERKEKKQRKGKEGQKEDANGSSDTPDSGIHPARLAMLSKPPVLSDWQPTRKRF
ncbi:hypothetical protein BDV96DRAFT_584340 [Lophiotrema nucula]|uniref:RRM domain-containing protein n=1 Tax=Lophiotrema nucula TaxID=690887 RepID=A0A6A5YVH7_9PLEO|nr:hypothetical protein BDV96DRAFT_584340 [Lophiotrema nucula]